MGRRVPRMIRTVMGHQPDASTLQHLDREKVEQGIAMISAVLKGRLDDTERALLFMDRRDLRARLAEIEQAEAA